jgi:serine O-acetyltransferase
VTIREHDVDVAGFEGEPNRAQFFDVVEALASADQAALQSNARGVPHRLPSPPMIEELLDTLRAVLFPRHFGRTDLGAVALRYFISTRLERAQAVLKDQVRCCLELDCDHPRAGGSHCRACDRRAVEVTEAVIGSLPRLRSLLHADATAAYEGDPAAKFLDETLYCYPGVTAVMQHRVAHELYRQGVPLLPRIIAELAHGATGIDIHPGARIGRSFFIDHGTGVVIGETCAIGERVRIYQGVTLGARGVSVEEGGRAAKGAPRHPIVEDDVIIYAGATILGRITIGRGSTIGGNVWLTRNVPPGSHVTQAQHRQQTFQHGSGI